MKGFTFFRNYYEAINDPENELTEEEQGKLYNAIFAYMFDGKEPELKGACRMAFNLIRVSLDLSKVRSESGKRGGEANDKQTESKIEANGSKAEANAKQNEANDKQTESEEDFACVLPLLEEEEKEISIRTNERNKKNKSSTAGAREGYAEIMRRWECSPHLCEALWAYIRHCSANKQIVTNDRFEELIGFLYDKYGAMDEPGMINSVYTAIRGGYYDFR